MAAATKDRMTPIKHRQRSISMEVAAATKIYNGTMVARNATGYAVPAADAAGQTVIGVAEAYVDNSTGADGDQRIRVAKGVFKFAKAGTVDRADVGKDMYVADDSTVSDAPGTNSIKVGVLDEVESDGAFVAIL